jgi:hypothetical protein
VVDSTPALRQIRVAAAPSVQVRPQIPAVAVVARRMAVGLQLLVVAECTAVVETQAVTAKH